MLYPQKHIGRSVHLALLKGGIMKKAKIEEPATVEDMRSEYDFSTMKGGVRTFLNSLPS
jgi:hypothetical protein